MGGERSQPLTITELLGLLRAAHKRRTASNRWLDAPDWLDRLSLEQLLGWRDLQRYIEDIAENKAEGRSNWVAMDREGPGPRGQKAVETLRRVLPQLIEKELALIQRGPNALLFTTREQFEQISRSRLHGLQTMLGSLFDIEPPHVAAFRTRLARKLSSWHSDALNLFDAFGAIMGSASTARNSPAVRFVEAVLSATGVVGVTCQAIEQMLRRNRQGLADRAKSRKALLARTH